MHIGIDLGTTNTVVSYARRRLRGGIEPKVLRINQLDEFNASVQDEILPSVLFLDFEGNIIVGKKAKYMKQYHPARTISNSKRYIGTSMKFGIEDRIFTPVAVAAHILSICRSTIDQNFAGKKIEQVTITVPASFNTDQIRDTRLAAIKAGFSEDIIRIIPEPTAAFIDFVNDQFETLEEDRIIDLSSQKRVLVFDLGGGTCDIVVMDVEYSNMSLRVEEKAVGRYSELGGIDFDIAAARYLLQKFLSDNKIKEVDNEIESMMSKLIVFCERAKEFFSNQINNSNMTENNNLSYRMVIPEFFRGKNQEFVISLREYNNATKDLYRSSNVQIRTIEDFDRAKNIVDPIFETLKRYEISPDSIDYVFLTGGMSQYYKVRKKLSEMFPKAKTLITQNPLESVSRGAAIFSFYEVEIKRQDTAQTFLEKSKKDDKKQEIEIITKTVLAESIMIDVDEGLPREIISKNQTVPFKGVIRNSFKVTSPSGIKIDIYAGESCFDCKMRMQKSFVGKFKFPVTPGTPLDIEYEIDENKYLKIRVIINDEFNPPIDLDIESDVILKN